ncbi:hypothetical protein JOF55_003912 [Haloactinomyces albus]|uniref:Uncharacterized protein n=1 Tax=Haloactinomyces albus TaxID=1352928 RepID=A0AAE4CNR6_9ACTN|nr:hypothetical protein [Haloactinomyces albus]
MTTPTSKDHSLLTAFVERRGELRDGELHIQRLQRIA